MAITDPWNIPIDINCQKYAIKGNMITAHIVMRDLDFLKIDPQTFTSDIKDRLVDNLWRELLQAKCIEFTKFEDRGGCQTHFRARMFVVPDDQVRILRVSQINNTIT
jgi:hypothetical protein